MNPALAALLRAFVPKAIAWAELQQRQVLACGAPLSAADLELARQVGVRGPEHIRVQFVEALPMPQDPDLRTVVMQAGLLGPGMIGMTLGYAVLARKGYETSSRLLSHEFRHVYQYEVLGSIGLFLPVYFRQIAQFGYRDAPFEVDARAHEQA